jgi:hypothetical protein
MVDIPVRESFSSREEAEAARDRLEYGGFQRTRVQLLRIGNQYVVLVYTRPDETDDARDLMTKTGWLPDWASRYGRGLAEHAPSSGQTLLGLGIAAAAGAALYWAYTRSQHGSNFPRLQWGVPRFQASQSRYGSGRRIDPANGDGDELQQSAAPAPSTGGAGLGSGSGSTH